MTQRETITTARRIYTRTEKKRPVKSLAQAVQEVMNL